MALTLPVDGMSCEHCEQTVEDACESVQNVTAAHADRSAGEVTIEGEADRSALVNAVEAAGYDVVA